MKPKNHNGSTPWHIAILIPARNEAALLERCLRSIERARVALPDDVTSDVVVVADRCIDNTLAIARRCLRSDGIAVRSSFGAVGHARARAADVALKRYMGAPNRCWLANTDADCELPDRWLTDQLDLADEGVEAIAGTVCVDSFEEHPVHVAARFRASYQIHADGSHPHIHGANLGLRADAYLTAGGWQGLSTAEDHDLWSRLKSTGHNCRSVSALEIVTSGRVIGRAPNGFAGALAAHDIALRNEATV